ncbi:hypothetical protein ACUC2M_02555 [Bacillus cytotoxicus]
MKRDKMALAFLALMGGALSVSIDNLLFTFSSIFTFFIYNIFFKRFTRKTVGLVPFQVFISALTAHLIVVYFAQQTVTMYDLLVSTIEAGLSFVLTMIFFTKRSVVNRKKGKATSLRNRRNCLLDYIISVCTYRYNRLVYL